MFLWSSQSHGEDTKLITEDAKRRPPQLTGQESFLEEVALGPGKMERRAQMVTIVSAPLTFSLPSPQACLGPCRTLASAAISPRPIFRPNPALNANTLSR